MAYMLSDPGVDEILMASGFRVSIPNILTQGVLSIGGLSSESATTDFRLSHEEPVLRKIPGLISYPEITIVTPVTRSNEWQSWRDDVYQSKRGGKPDPRFKRKVTIELIDVITGTMEVLKRWIVSKAYPSKLEYDELNSTSNDPLKVTITLCHSGWRQTVASALSQAT